MRNPATLDTEMSDFELANQRNFFVERALGVQDFGLTTSVAIAAVAGALGQEAFDQRPVLIAIGFLSITIAFGISNVRRARKLIDHAKRMDDLIINDHLRAENLIGSTRRNLFFGSNPGMIVLLLIAMIIIGVRISW